MGISGKHYSTHAVVNLAGGGQPSVVTTHAKGRAMNIRILGVLFIFLTIAGLGLSIERFGTPSFPWIGSDLTGEALVREVGRVAILPNEEPMTATVTDPAQLVGQSFFSQAMAGDKVLVFPLAQRAILYRPSSKQIVEMMPFEVPPEVASMGR
jgi:hypothetical protein